MKCIKKSKPGFTLVEVILAIAILGLVVAFMTPVLLSGFRQIVLSGERNKTVKLAVGAMESDLASGIIPEGNDTYTVTIGNGITVDAFILPQSETGRNGTVGLNGYIPPAMPTVSPMPKPTPTPIATPTPTPTPIPSPTPTPDPLATPSPTPEVTPTPTDTPMPTPAPPISFDGVTLDISGWSITSPFAVLSGTTTQMAYRIVVDDVETNTWIICMPNGSGNIYLTLPMGTSSYRIDLRQTDNETNTKSLFIRKAPRIRIVTGKNSNFVAFQVYDELLLDYVPVLDSHSIQYARNGGTWVKISTGLNSVKKLETGEYFYFRYSDGNDIIGITRTDPPSLYIKIP